VSLARRLDRMEAVLDARLGRVSCAIQAVHHRHNVSAILRTCDALGIHRVDLVEGHFTATAGTARGAERWLDLHHHESVDAAVHELRKAGFRLWVADLDPDSRAPERVPVDRPVCLWFGAELEGVAEGARAAADGVVQVPMHGMAQSLNVSVAAALTLRPVAERARALGAEALLGEDARAGWWRRWVHREERLWEAARSRTRWRWTPP
jgi:tRNA (guanosine-2'-O-)-methyltransferase